MTDNSQDEHRPLVRDGEPMGRINLSADTSGDQFRQTSAAHNADGAAKRKKLIIKGLIGAGILVVVVLAIVLPIVLTRSSGDSPGPEPPGPPGPDPPIPPEPPVYSNETVYNPYVVDVATNDGSILKGHLQAQEPYEPEKHARAFKHLTSRLNEDEMDTHNLTTLPHEFPIGENNRFIPNLAFEFYLKDYSTGVFTVTDADSTRYTIDNHVVWKGGYDHNMRLDMMGFKLYNEPFSFEYSDVRDSSNWYLHTNASSLVFMDKFIQMDFQLPSQKIFGFGERIHEFKLGEGTWTMWAKGQNAPYDDGLGGKNSYGVHPFILIQSKKKGDFFGMFFRNSNAQSPVIKYNYTTGESTLSYITTGGQIEVYIYMHGSAKAVIQAYHYTIGTPNLPPFWALGWHQASYAYNTQDDVEEVLENYAKNNFPIDVMWLDIPYLDAYADFSVNKTAFPNLPDLGHRLHNNYKRLVVINDAGISADDNSNKYYRKAYLEDALIKSSEYPDNPYHGAAVTKVWPNHTVFLDWFSPESEDVWHTGLHDLYQQIPFDGLWLDMNEPTGFCSGECYDGIPKAERKDQEKRVLSEQVDGDMRVAWFKSYLNQDENSTYNLPFIPGYHYGGNLDNMTISLNATHKNGNIQYDVHSLYGHMMCEKTYSFLIDEKYNHSDNRPFILTRSSFAGTGRFAAHWTGDNFREWRYMNYSIAGIMNMQMFGIPMVGSDVCGFFGPGDLDQELCARWIQLATFYPFARLHYANDSTPSEPYRLEGQWAEIARKSMLDRYQYMRLMYTCIFEASRWGSTCFDPLFFHYPTDENTYHNIEESFIVANAIKVSPIIVPGVTEEEGYSTYFPKGKWVSLIDYSVVDAGTEGKVVNLKPSTTVQVHLQPGSLIPFQDNSDHRIDSVHKLFEKPITIIANLDDQGKATGVLFVDTGNSRREYNDQEYEYYRLSIQAKTLQKQLAEGQHASQNGYLDKVLITNAKQHSLKDVDFACYFTHHFDIVQMKTSYDANTDVLTIDTPPDHVKFSDFRQINFGTSKYNDLNLCDPNSYQYKIKDGVVPDLSKDTAAFTLQNLGSGQDLRITLSSIDSTFFNIKWTFDCPLADYTPFEVPKDIIDVKKSSNMYPLSNFIKIVNTAEFGIQIISPKTKKVMIDLREILLGKYLNHYSQTLYTKAGDYFKGVMGLGERVSDDLFYKDGVYSMWSRDAGMPFDDGRPAGKNVYGTHPLMVFEHDTDMWVGTFTNLANAQDWYIKNDKEQGTVQTTLVAAGGLGDIYVMIDNNPAGILTQYQKIIGKPITIPHWALGWHQCKWGYSTTQDLENVLLGYSDNNIPLDTIWSDIDYLLDYRDFTYDKQRFEKLPEFVQNLHQIDMHYVPIIDAGISARSKGEYETYDSGIENDIFVKLNKEVLVGKVWPKDAAYPDFWNPKTPAWWQDQLTSFHKQINFDGLWLDMNEASNFADGINYPDQLTDWQIKYTLKYVPTGRDLEQKSMPLDAEHYGGYKEIDTHSLFGTLQVKATHEWFQNNKNRTLIIERSSFAGMGKFGSRWLGDNYAAPAHMGGSVTGIMMMNMFGIPFAGSDICGFAGNTNPELCARWHVVGAFQPFSRNHNDWAAIPQEPYVDIFQSEYEPGVTYTDIMRAAIRTKYHLIKYYYTQLYLLSQEGGKPFYNPLFIEYPNDMNTYRDYKFNVMLGPALKLSVLSDSNLPEDQFDDKQSFYFPQGIWCNIFDYAEKCFQSEGEFQTKRTKVYDAYVHLREGYIVPMQEATIMQINTTAQLQQHPVDFHILGSKSPYPNVEWHAAGVFINDDGLTTNYTNTTKYSLEASYSIQGGKCQAIIKFENSVKIDGCFKHNQNDILGNIILHNAQDSKADGQFIVFAYYTSGESEQIGFANWEAHSDKLTFTPNEEICMTELLYIKMSKTECII